MGDGRPASPHRSIVPPDRTPRSLSRALRHTVPRHGHIEFDARIRFPTAANSCAIDAALAQAKKLATDGADIIDVGAEIDPPGSYAGRRGGGARAPRPPSRRADKSRSMFRFRSIPPRREVARRAIELGASVVNDVWGLQNDPAHGRYGRRNGRGGVVMHNRDSVDPDLDIVADMRRFFDRSLRLAEKAGDPARHLILDPGHWFRQNQGAKFRGAGPPSRAHGLRSADPRRRFAQIRCSPSAVRGVRRPAHRHARRQSRRRRQGRVNFPGPRRGGACAAFEVFDAIARG